MHRQTIIGLVALIIAGCGQPSAAPTADQEPVSLQTRLLAEEILKNTPEHIHFAPFTRFQWVLLSPKTQDNPPDLQEEVVRQLARKYTVYMKQEDLPEDLMTRGEDGTLIGYKGGFSFRYNVQFENETTVKIRYSDWEGNLAASFHWKRYEWTGHHWRVIEKSGILVS
jgi:hypothetical protein